MTCKKVIGRERTKYLDWVWDLYVKTYKSIGTHLNSPRDLLGYDLWELCGDPPIVCYLSKVTPFGIKAGITCSDGSSTAKSEIKSYLRKRFFIKGRYGEVSHKVEEIAKQVNAPVVCANDAQAVLRKPIQEMPDGIHYKRSLGSLGTVKKVLVGRPLNVPITNFESPSCKVFPLRVGSTSLQDDSEFSEQDVLEHISCLLWE